MQSQVSVLESHDHSKLLHKASQKLLFYNEDANFLSKICITTGENMDKLEE